MDTVTKTGIGSLKTASKKVIHKAAEGTAEFIGNKIADKIVKPEANSTNAEETVIPTEKREEILNELRQVLSRWNTIKDLNY